MAEYTAELAALLADEPPAPPLRGPELAAEARREGERAFGRLERGRADYAAGPRRA